MSKQIGASSLRSVVNQTFKGKDAFEIVVRTVGGLVAAYLLFKVTTNATEYKESLLRFIFKLLKKVPAVQGKIQSELGKAMKDVKHSFQTPGEKFVTIPEHGKSYADVLALLRESQQFDVSKYGSQKLSGTIYLGDDSHTAFTNEAYGMFNLSNPLHADVFPNVRRFESEVASMTARMLHGGSTVCGAMTSGGTESILMAVKAYRDFARAKRGVTNPELVVPVTVHSAFDKACHYFNIKLIHIPVGADFKVDLNAVKNAINRNTIAIVGSAPNFPHGMIDDIQGLATIAKAHKVGLHVDACLGGFVLPFIAKLPGSNIPKFDFEVDGVTSMSADTHKYGYAPKGTSVVLFSTPELRQYMYFAAPNWTGGAYGSPTMPGSRPGGLIAAAWATLVALGQDGYKKHAESIMEAVNIMREGVKTIPELHIVGDPKAMVIAFATHNKNLDIFQVNAAMGKRGWGLNALQRPAALHICVTAKHAGTGPKFVEDLRASVDEVLKNPDMYKKSTAAMYGLAATMPDRALVSDMIVGVLDTMLDA